MSTSKRWILALAAGAALLGGCASDPYYDRYAYDYGYPTTRYYYDYPGYYYGPPTVSLGFGYSRWRRW